MPRTTFYVNEKVQVTFQPNIGLDAAARQSVVEILNILLADESVLLFKTHRAEEQPGEIDVSDLSLLLKAQRIQINEIILELAERVNIMGSTPLLGSVELVDASRLYENPDAVPDVLSILADHEAFIRFLREDARKCSEVYEDQGSFAQLIEVLRQHEKMAWMLRPYIQPGLLHDHEQVI